MGAMVYEIMLLQDGHIVRCVYYGNTMQYKREQAFSHYRWRVKSTNAICSKAPRAVKEKLADCGGRVPIRMDAAKVYGEGGEASAPTSNQSMHNNGGVANVISIGPSSPTCKALSTEPSWIASSAVSSRSMRQQELDMAYQLNKRKELDEK